MSIQDMLTTGLSGGAILLFIIFTIVQITPIKFNPWSAIARAFGNAINHDIKEEITNIKNDMTDMKTDLSKIKDTNDERYAIQCRIRILRFNDELLINVDHTKDYYDQILLDVDEYEKYCLDHPDFKNNMTLFAVDNIKKCYKNCLANHKFL